MSTAEDVKQELKKISSAEKSNASSWFFKSGKGQYGEGDKFIGVTVPEQRKISKKYYSELSLVEVKKLLSDSIHEYRLTALLILCDKFQKSGESEQEKICKFYLENKEYCNNWDLVDSSAPYILGAYLLDKADRSILYDLSESKSLWDNRIAIIATYAFIKAGQFEDTYKVSEKLLNHTEDLIHKAVGWMLREAGNRDLKAEEQFLGKHYKQMPRTMLRYAIEKFEETKRKAYLKGEI